MQPWCPLNKIQTYKLQFPVTLQLGKQQLKKKLAKLPVNSAIICMSKTTGNKMAIFWFNRHILHLNLNYEKSYKKSGFHRVGQFLRDPNVWTLILINLLQYKLKYFYEIIILRETHWILSNLSCTRLFVKPYTVGT